MLGRAALRPRRPARARRPARPGGPGDPRHRPRPGPPTGCCRTSPTGTSAASCPASASWPGSSARIGALGMSLTGYGCAGASAVQYGLACLELEAADSGIRSLVSVQGSLAMYAIHRFGSEEQKQRWLPGMAAGEIIGCFGLTEPDHGSDPAGMRTSPSATARDWVLTAARCGSPTARWPGSRSYGRRPTRASAASSCPPTPRVLRPRDQAQVVAAGLVTSELVLDDVRLPADAVLPDVTGLRGPLAV